LGAQTDLPLKFAPSNEANEERATQIFGTFVVAQSDASVFEQQSHRLSGNTLILDYYFSLLSALKIHYREVMEKFTI
jgi:hypothetical protein